MITLKTVILSVLLFSPIVSQASTFDTNMNEILGSYLKIQKLLAEDKTEGVLDLAKSIRDTGSKLNLDDSPKKFLEHYKNIPSQIADSSSKLIGQKSIEGMRENFKLLSQPVANWVEMAGPQGVSVYFCSMAKASWVQSEGNVENPYYGSKMLKCGEKVVHHKTGHNHEH